MEQMIREKLHKLIDAFTPILYEDDETFLRNMKDRNLARVHGHLRALQGVGGSG